MLFLRVLCCDGSSLIVLTLPTGLGEAILFCPKMLYNQQTAQYVLWFNWIEGANFAASYYAVATSKSLMGPYTLVVKQVPRCLHMCSMSWGFCVAFKRFSYFVSIMTLTTAYLNVINTLLVALRACSRCCRCWLSDNHITACNVCHQVTTLAFADTGDFSLFQDTDGSGCVD